MIRSSSLAVSAIVLAALLYSSANAASPTPAPSGSPQGSPGAGAAAPAGPRIVVYKDDKLTVHAERMPADDVLAEIHRQSGAAINGTLRDPSEVTVDFDARPLQEALERVLVDQNFTLKYAADGKLKEIDLRGGPEARKKPAKPEAPGLAGEEHDPTPKAWIGLQKTFFGDKPVPVTGKLAEFTGKSPVGWDMLINTAVGAPDPRVRREAMRAASQAVEANPALKQAVIEAAKGINPEAFATWARSVCFHMCEDFMRNIIRETDIPEVRKVAREINIDLRRQPFQGPKPEMH